MEDAEFTKFEIDIIIMALLNLANVSMPGSPEEGKARRLIQKLNPKQEVA